MSLCGQARQAWQQGCLYCLKQKEWDASKNYCISKLGDLLWFGVCAQDVDGDWSGIDERRSKQ
jgi:hypothetical protein